MAVTGDVGPAHANADRFDLAYPDGATFAERHMLGRSGTTIATDRYTSADFLAREIEHVWLHEWQMACRAEEIPNPGDHVPYTIADQEHLVVRQRDGSIRAFHNVCRHRGNLLRRAPGCAEELRCRYHHWCWDLDGTLVDIPDRHLYGPIDDDAYALGEIGCDTWGGFVFVHPGPAATRRPLRELLGAAADQLEPYHLERMVAVTHVRTSLACNWKVAVEAFLEVYHVQGIHPQLLPMLDDVNTAYELLGPHSRMIVPFGVPSMRLDDVAPGEVLDAYAAESGDHAARHRVLTEAMFEDAGADPGDAIRAVRAALIERARGWADAAGHDLSHLRPGQLIDDWHYHLFPGLVMNLHATGFLLFRVRPDGTDPDRCAFDVYRFRLPGAGRDLTPAPPVDVAQGAGSFGTVLDQDFENLPGVQRGLHSNGLHHLTISAQEVRVAHVHAVIDQYLAGER